MSPAELEPHTVVVRQCRLCDGLNVTVELLTFGPEMTDKNPFTDGYFILASTHPKAASRHLNAVLSARIKMQPHASVIYVYGQFKT